MQPTSTYQPRIGNYGTLATGTISGFFIQLGTECKQDHVVLYAGFRNGVEMVLEAKPHGGVQFSPLSDYDGIPIAWNMHDKFTDEEGIAIIKEGEKHLHDKYNWRADFLNALRILHITSDKFFSEKMKKSTEDMCSQLATILYFDAIGWKLSNKPVWLTTTADLFYRNAYIY